jgi:2-isopropylmalate synthase
METGCGLIASRIRLVHSNERQVKSIVRSNLGAMRKLPLHSIMTESDTGTVVQQHGNQRDERARRTVLIADTTLRDGEQMAGCYLRIDDKVAIGRLLVDAGVRSIEAGFPGAGPHQFEATREIARGVGGAVISALSRTHERDIEAAAKALSDVPAYRRAIGLFISTSSVALTQKLRLDEAQLMRRIDDAVRAAKACGFRNITFSAEDASRTEPETLRRAYAAAIGAGATALGYADTVGIDTPESVQARIDAIRNGHSGLEGALLGVHFHNDLGLATANSLAAVKAGAQVVQCTIGGIGERAGNASLEEVTLCLALHPQVYGARSSIRLERLRDLNERLSQASGLATPTFKPVVGRDIFVTAAGIHQDGLAKDPDTYFPYPPALLGVQGFEFQLNHHSGKGALRFAFDRAGIACQESDIDAALALLKQEPGVGIRANVRSANELLNRARRRMDRRPESFVHEEQG